MPFLTSSPTRQWRPLAAAVVVLATVATGAAYRELAAVRAVAPGVVSASVYSLTVNDLGGQRAPLRAYAGQVALVVNVASECGLATQYPDIQALYERYASRGFVVLAFPSGDFGNQEHTSPDAIREACDLRGVTFPVFARSGVRPGDGQSPVYALLGETGSLPRWNFAKYVLGRDGRPRAFFGSFVSPADPALVTAIERALSEPVSAAR